VFVHHYITLKQSSHSH